MSLTLGVLCGLLAAAAVYRWSRAPRLARVLAALALACSGVALVPAIVRGTLQFETLAPGARELGERVVMFDLAAAVVGALGGVCLAVRRPALAGAAGFSVLFLARRYFTATAAWSLALWDQVIVEPRLVADIALDIVVAGLLIAGGIVGARRG